MNIPNLLTVLRFLLIPVFIYFFFLPNENGIGIAVIVFLIAGLTDTLDGYIARKYNQITKLGIVLDPLADKLMLITVLVSIAVGSDIPKWIIILVASKELLMILGAISLYNLRNVVIPANIFGKLATLLSYAAILAVIFKLPFRDIVLYVYVTATVLAFIIYINNFLAVKGLNQFDLIKK
ncbi:MAG: CDP-diacylglycerol--glycerol-3-phosphate 3-phosphatidyltransferase [Clostridia bacterium]|jgi:cardiolipin synthase|nr:CDP-diacylglycerol--glycerol-3-phosphate 3-phosphatidyltransferase [Clostridia bacterium]